MEKTLSIIKPDAVERNLTKDIKNIFIKNNLKIINSKKYTFQEKKPQSFTKFTKQNLFMMIYAPIFHLVLYLLLH